MKKILLSSFLGHFLFAQAPIDAPLKLGDEVCITPGNLSTPLTRFPKEKRIDISNFGVLDSQDRLQTIAEHKGKLLVLYFWIRSCPASLRGLKAMGYFQKEEKRGDFLAWPIHNEGWPWVLSYVRRKSPEFDGIRLFKAAMAEHGMHVLGDPIVALPMIYIIDRKGRIAASYSGFRDNFLAKLINEYYSEKD